VTFRLSKEDKECGGDGVPLTFLEYEIEGVRPVDVFNVLTDAQKEPEWDTHCAKMDLIGEMRSKQARGFDSVWVAPGTPVSAREGIEWQATSQPKSFGWSSPRCKTMSSSRRRVWTQVRLRCRIVLLGTASLSRPTAHML